MDNQVLLIILLSALGLGILVLEVFIPSGGILTVMAAVCFVGSTYFAWRAWYQPGHTTWWWGYVISMLVLLPVAVSSAVYILPRTSYGQKILATPPSLDELTPFRDEETRLSSLIDRHGRARTMFSPGGMVEIDGERFHAESEGVLIDPGTDVVVVRVRGNRLVVRPTDDSERPQTEAPSPESPSGSDPLADSDRPSDRPTDQTIDFDYPETV